MSDPFFKNLELQIMETGTDFWACRSCVSFANTFGKKVNEKLKQIDKRVNSLQEKVEANTGGLEEVQDKVETVEKRMEKLERPRRKRQRKTTECSKNSEREKQ